MTYRFRKILNFMHGIVTENGVWAYLTIEVEKFLNLYGGLFLQRPFGVVWLPHTQSVFNLSEHKESFDPNNIALVRKVFAPKHKPVSARSLVMLEN